MGTNHKISKYSLKCINQIENKISKYCINQVENKISKYRLKCINQVASLETRRLYQSGRRLSKQKNAVKATKQLSHVEQHNK